ncbi:hypothetical protein PFLUV_G00099830 [Perca fluviatilis]|uniref:Uncharacterized protein n=1 Tax=Perca fluviatilis TaxID=8168 RepID=A0A6A5ECB9_PERFL|nr:uncharacterized protein tasor2 isoform X2 [Perca fluviatilis]KAF1386917.1 hypothetical protein PFLUV_G00099830 [Perca fluviatilis]
MESGNGGASRKGVLVAVSESSGVFQNNILAPLKSAYLYEESKQSFRYTSAVLVKNPALEEKYCAFRAKRKEEGYSEEDLKESYGFLLFDDVNKANALGETGVLTGNSTCTTLGDPSKGVYVSMYSDCLDLNRWYHGKSGYIAIIRLTKGRVKKVLENYTQNFTAPTVGFDCHVSEQFPSVSAKTSSFLAFERTQYYMYELLDDGSNVTTQSPSAACPFAIVSFSYTDTKATIVASQEKSEVKNLVCHYLPWRGQLQIGTLFYDVGLRSTVALIPAELPPVVKIGRAISMSDLRQLLPRAVFETCFSGEVFLDGLYFSLYELVSSEAVETNSLPLLLREIKEKDLALTIQLNDGGFLILLHSSHFLTYDDTGSSATDVLQGMFVFPVSQVIQTDTKSGGKKPAISSEILHVLQVLNYAEGEVEKTSIDPGEELCEVLAQHMQRYAALINPGLALSPARELSIFPDQYDVPDAHKHLYSCPELTNRAWQSFRSYLSKPVSFQLPLSKASEILAPRQEERIEDLDDDVYICLSSPEEAPANPVSMESEDQLTGQRSPVNIETPVDTFITSAAVQVDVTAVPQNVVPDDLHAGDATKYTGKSDLTVLIKTDDMGAKNVLTPSTSDDLPAELIVSITSAEQTVTDESLDMISTVSATMHNDIQLSGFSTAKLQMTGVNSLNDETVTTKKVLDCPEFTKLTKTQKRKLRRGYYKGRKRVSNACVETPSLQIPVEDDNLKSQKEDQAKESSGHPQLSNPSYIERRKVQRRKCKFRKPSSSVGLAVAEEKKLDPGQQNSESTFLMELETFPLRKKTERWDLKPVISECGRILVPHGSLDIADQIKSLKDKITSTKDEKMLVDASVNDTVEMEQESSTAPKTAVDETEATTSKDGGNLKIVVSDNPEHNILRPSDDGNGLLTLNQESTEHSSKTDCTETSPSEAVKEKHTNTLSPEKIATKGELLLSKLKSVLLRGKRKMDFLVSKEMTADTAQDTEPHLKKGKVDSDTGMLKSNYTITSVQDTNAHVKEVSKMLSLDPLFAYALGLTPKETPDKIQKTEGQDTQQRKDSSETQEQTILDKQPQIIHRPPSIFPRRGRIKMLKKHQGVSADNVKKKWWLHFQTPACYASEKLNYKECTRDNSVRKTVKEKMNSACSSTDALNLLADLALSASNDQVPPQPDPALERKPETSLKKCDLTKDVTTAEQESVLHALLRQPAARSMQPLESPSPSHLMGGSELVGLVSKEHAYSLPPSSSLLLGLPGTPFQVSPLSGSTRLLHHHQTMNGDGIKTLHPSVSQTDRSEKNHRTPEYLEKHMVCRRKFRHSRTFVDKDGSIQVTKEWKENYDFNLDSKFTNDSKDRTIIRALHGPWDFSMQDTNEEVRLIVHMWIGLFYSRSTDRFFHVDSYPCSEESDCLEMPSGMESTLAQSELKAYSFAPFPSVTDASDPLISKALDLSKKQDSVLDQGSVVLDLSLRNSNAEIVTSDPQVNRKETSVSGDLKEASETLKTLKSSMGLQEASTIQCHKKKVHYTEINDAGSTHESKTKIAGSLENTGVPSCKDDRTFILVQDEMKSISIQSENNPAASGIGHVLDGCNNEKTDMKDGLENKMKKAGRLEHTDVPSCKGDETFIVVQKEMESVSVQPENNLTASGIGHVLHGCNSEETNVKHSIENNRKKVGSLEHTDVPSCKGDETFIFVQKEMESASVQPENNLTASGIGHVLHGCNNEKMDMKDGIGNKRKKAGSLEHTDVPSCKGDGTFIVQKEMESVSVRPENQIASGHVLHGCDNEKTDMKDGIKNSEATAMSLVQKHGKDSSKSVTVVEVDSNKEAGNVVLTVKHDAIESKDGENLEVKENPYQQGNVEPSPKVILTDDESTNKESGIVCNGYLLENEKQLSGEEPVSVSPGKAENVKDVDCCTVYKGKVIEDEDPFGKENGFDEKDRCVSPVEANSELSDHPQPINCDGPDSVKNYITECNQKPPFDEQPPKHNEEDACHDLHLRKLCANGSVLTDENAISEKFPPASSEMEPISNEPAVEGNSKNYICLADKAHYQKAAIPMSDENNCSLEVSNANGSIPQTNESVETECQNKVMANFNLIGVDHEDGDTQSIEGDQKIVNTTEKEQFYHQAHSPQCEAEAALTKETDLKQIEKTNEGLEKINIVSLIPFIGIDSSREDTVQQPDTHSQGKVEEVDQEEIPFISKTTYPETVQPTGLCSTSEMYSKKPERSAVKISLSLLDVSETSDDRCPTPTMDEKPFQYLTCSGPSTTSASAFSGSETSKNMTQKCLNKGSTSRKDEVPHKSTFNSDATTHHELELRTHRVLQSIDKFRHQTSHTKTSSQIETAEKHILDQTPNPKSKYIPTCFTTSHISSDFKDKKMQCNTTPAVMSASTSPELHTESTSNFLISPFKSKLEEVLGVKLQLNKTNSPVQQHYFERIDKLQEKSVGQDCHPYRSIPCTESLQAIKPNIDQGRHKTTSQSNLSHELRSYSQRPVMAVKPSKTDECQADCISKDKQIENAVMSHFSVNKPTETPVVTYTIPTTMFLEKKTESLKENSEGLNDDKQDASELSSKSSWLSNVSDSKSNSDTVKFVLQDPLKPHQGRDISKLNYIPLSSFPAQSFESAKKFSKLVDGNQGFITYSSVEKVGQTTKESIEIDQKDCSDASTSHAVYKDGGIIDDSLFLGPQSSLMCTVYNTSRKKSYSFLEQVSQRCLQDDPTEASIEQECLIFSEQMKQLLKRSKRGPVRQQGTHDELNLSCASPVTVHFCSLEEQEDSVDQLTAHLDAPSLVGQRIKVNMSDRKKTTDEDQTHPPNVSRGTGNPMEHAGVSAVTSECVRLYEAMMNDVCAVKKVPSRPQKHFRIHRSYSKAEPSNHFDFCDQMKREMDESFRSNLNSVVKKSCKTKYRFYVLLTSDDAFFEETKAQLEAEGHTAVQPSEFFLGEDSSSSLLIILRNEDIAEHICEVPHLLELKKSPGAQFAGIDEPDDVVNLTHQELFTRGGFVMFDRAALESLSFCKMKKMSEILQERGRTGKWKWMLHYRDSRRLKENARLSAEAKEKTHFLNWCQEAGILEVLPYHECDLMSREQPDYLTCLVRLQVQNISARYPVFITDTTTDSAFGKNGILTMTFDSFLMYSPSKPITA